ncbi:MAG: excisionase family DNA-binding protein [Georgenia sp.]
MHENPQPIRLLTMGEAADRLGVSTRFVRMAVRDGLISTVRLGRLVRFRPEDVEQYIDQQVDPARAGHGARNGVA